MAIRKYYGEGEVRGLAEQAGKARAAQAELDRRWKKDMAMMDYQFRLAAEQRSRAWELEKMEIASRHDFAMAEENRVQKQKEYETKMNRIDEFKDQIGAEGVRKLKMQVTLKNLGLDEFAIASVMAQPSIQPQAAQPTTQTKEHELPIAQAQDLANKFPNQFQIVGQAGDRAIVQETPLQSQLTPTQEKALQFDQFKKDLGEVHTDMIDMARRAAKRIKPGVDTKEFFGQLDETQRMQEEAVRDLVLGLVAVGRKKAPTGEIPQKDVNEQVMELMGLKNMSGYDYSRLYK